MSDRTLKEVQQIVDDWIMQVGKGYWTPHEMLARLMEEVGETARLVNHLYGSKPNVIQSITLPKWKTYALNHNTKNKLFRDLLWT